MKNCPSLAFSRRTDSRARFCGWIFSKIRARDRSMIIILTVFNVRLCVYTLVRRSNGRCCIMRTPKNYFTRFADEKPLINRTTPTGYTKYVRNNNIIFAVASNARRQWPRAVVARFQRTFARKFLILATGLESAKSVTRLNYVPIFVNLTYRIEFEPDARSWPVASPDISYEREGRND